MKQKHICVVTGSRAEYGLMKLIIRGIQESNDLKLSLVVTGMHLLKKYGNTIDIIRKDGIPITKAIPIYEEDIKKKDNLGRTLGTAITEITGALDEINPDLLLVLGDRYEPLAAVLAASTLNIPIAHIHGGDNVHKGQIDEQIRHAITKFAHIHFPVSEKSSERIKLLGEEEWRIHMVGSPGIDMIFQEVLFTKEEVCRNLKLNKNEKIILCIQHPYTFESEKAGEQMHFILKILEEINYQTIIIYPNNDPGSDQIINAINLYNRSPKFKIYKNLERKTYLSLLKHIDLLIGNSSSGIIESPIFKLPVINLGDRNKGRETGENVINVVIEPTEIKKAIKIALSDDFKETCQNVKNPYGEGKATEKIIQILSNLVINKNLLIKRLTYRI
jgi:UDP-hydrolysing UDP-N-acetyl-D-glucosamine 2-epimerase